MNTSTKIKAKKDPFAELPPEWKDAVEAMSVDNLKNEMVSVSSNEHENQKNKEEDQDLASKKELYKEAGAGYKEASKANKLKIKYVLRHLSDKGAL